ncbi:uncharacterized protein A4U43_C08F8000 [Asparagus officinalis]|nr:uncharacterized protein A4U43_C08F8000 [Asparagus officinalis]
MATLLSPSAILPSPPPPAPIRNPNSNPWPLSPSAILPPPPDNPMATLLPPSVPDSWKERLVSKVEKGTNGTDSEFYNPRKKSEKEYLTFLSGFRALAPMDAVLSNLALSDVELQDLITGAEEGVKSKEAKDGNGHVYYEYEIDGVGAHSLIKVT